MFSCQIATDTFSYSVPGTLMGKPLQPQAQYVPAVPVGIKPVVLPAATIPSLRVPSPSLIRASEASTPQPQPSTSALPEAVSEALTSTNEEPFNLSNFLDQDEKSQHSAESEIDVIKE